MSLYDKAVFVAGEMLDNQLFSGCALRQTNQRRAGSLNLMHASLRAALDDAQREERADGLGESRLMRTVRLVDAVRRAVEFGLFKDFRDPPYRVDETPERTVEVRLIEARATALLELADANVRPDTRSSLERIHQHVEDATQLIGELKEFDPELFEQLGDGERNALNQALFAAGDAATTLLERQNAAGCRPS